MYVSKELALILKEKGWNCGSDKDWYVNIPEHKVLNWIFNQLTEISVCQYWRNELEWLQFWYNILVEYKFSLMYEFIGRLEEWFESNNIEFAYYNSEYHVTGKTDKGIIEYNTLYEITSNKQQGKHEAILKCFELLKLK